jgi:hypothetical protein
MAPALLETKFRSRPPEVCPKPFCHGTRFIVHEDGWQCLNCMKVIYRYKRIVDHNRQESFGTHRYVLSL